MKAYQISVPAFTQIVFAHNQKEALEQFWFDFDTAQQDPDWGKPIIRPIIKPAWTRKPTEV